MARIRVRTDLVHGLLGFLLLVLLSACAAPATRFDALARDAGLHRHLLAGTQYDQVIYANTATGPTLHVYLSGDGTPWQTRHRPALDPTPRRPVVLALMARDPAPSILLGRPCYHGLSRAPGCSVWDWTAGRYSQRVVNSSVEALARWVRCQPVEHLVVIGYSGGGTLAMLLTEFWEARRRSEDLPPIRQVVTIAANLDIDRWTEMHDYSPLLGSLNPVRRPPLAEHIRQWHLGGGRDQNVPVGLLRDALSEAGVGGLWVFPQMDHGCCWEQAWPQVLGML